jgi:uncharacterized membrane protein YphA (DoxX/SURF4 family)
LTVFLRVYPLIGVLMSTTASQPRDLATPYHAALNYRDPFGYTVAVIETLIAIGLLTGCYSRLVFIGGAIFSAGIWTAAEGMGLPIQAGQTDIGTNCIYVLVYIALFLGAAGSTWSVDAWFRGRGGKVSVLRG